MSDPKNFKDIIDRILSLSLRDQKTLQEKALKVSEECGELAEAVLSYTDAHGCQYKGKTREQVIEEATDVITVAFSILCEIGQTDLPYLTYGNMWNIDDIWSKKLDKWEEKLNENPYSSPKED
jgi:NTP pyrophosphatase (non-canonical NTP hydrolase)